MRIVTIVFASIVLGSLALAHPFAKEQKRRRLMAPVPSDLDTSRERTGKSYRVMIDVDTESGSIPLGQHHSWILKIDTLNPAFTKASDLAVNVDGDMPRHGHGLPTKPIVKRIGAKTFEVSGMLFHMPGWWQAYVTVRTGRSKELFKFDLLL